jgi:hypothetical protein
MLDAYSARRQVVTPSGIALFHELAQEQTDAKFDDESGLEDD